jgi:uncharacterized protein (DUF1800 family)
MPKGITPRKNRGAGALFALALAALSIANAFAAPALTQAFSRKTHGAAGDFDLVLDRLAPLSGSLSVEPRYDTTHRIVLRFNETITATGNASSTTTGGGPIGNATASFSGTDVTVTLSGIENARRVSVNLNGVTSASGSANVSVAVGFLVGDVTNNRAVASADWSQIKARAGQTVDNTNFVFDINLSGIVSAADIAVGKAKSGSGVSNNTPPLLTLSAAATGQVSIASALTATPTVNGATVTKVEFFESGVKLGETTASPHTFTWKPGVEGPTTVSAKVTDSNGLTATSPAINVAVSAHPQADAARLLQQASFGATQAEIARVAGLGVNAYLNEQFAAAQTSHLATVSADPFYPTEPYSVMMPSIWKQFFEANDQLRQRMAFALSQILVISMNNNTLGDQACATASYLDLLGTHAFGNFKDLLKAVTLSPAMGEYLDMKGSAKADPMLMAIPNENYPRELMQLFSIGTVMLNDDGSVQFSGGKPIPTYNENTVKEVSRALTGWTFAGQDQTKPWRWLYPDVPYPSDAASAAKACTAWSTPMAPWTATYRANDDKRDISGGAHDLGGKTLLTYPGSMMFDQNVAPYTTMNPTPSQLAAAAMADVDAVVNNIFNHPNVGPFIGEQLIQRLVMSNPSGAYVSRVSAAFNNNGSGVRGDMKAVIRAILTDSEARQSRSAQPAGFGKLREPVLRFVHMHRAFNAKMAGGSYRSIYDLTGSDSLGQNPLKAPSVFNFYHPDYGPSGVMAQAGLLGPEFEITNSATIAGFMDFSGYGIVGGFGQGDSDPNKRTNPDYAPFIALANDPAAMVDAMNLSLLAGGMSAQFRNQLIDMVTKLTDSNATTQSTERYKTALWLILNSPEYSIQK